MRAYCRGTRPNEQVGEDPILTDGRCEPERWETRSGTANRIGDEYEGLFMCSLILVEHELVPVTERAPPLPILPRRWLAGEGGPTGRGSPFSAKCFSPGRACSTTSPLN
jgi:hypothetical protein